MSQTRIEVFTDQRNVTDVTVGPHARQHWDVRPSIKSTEKWQEFPGQGAVDGIKP
jgi:hypothetical protein